MENAAETIAPVASRQRAHRSAVSNGTKLFCVDGLDGRSQPARRFRDLVETSQDLGGRHLSKAKAACSPRGHAFDNVEAGAMRSKLGF